MHASRNGRALDLVEGTPAKARAAPERWRPNRETLARDIRIKCERSYLRRFKGQSLCGGTGRYSSRRTTLLRQFQFNNYGSGMFLLAVLTKVPIHLTKI